MNEGFFPRAACVKRLRDLALLLVIGLIGCSHPAVGGEESVAIEELLQEGHKLAEYQPHVAAQRYESALALALKAKDRRLEAAARFGVGSVFNYDYPGRIAHLELAAEIYRQLQNKAGEAKALKTMGLVYCEMGFYRQALGPLQQAIDLWRETEEAESAAHAHAILADVHEVMGSYEAALDEWEEALALWQVKDASFDVAVTRYRLGQIDAVLGLDEAAEKHFEAAIPLLEEIGQPTNFPTEAELEDGAQAMLSMLKRIGKAAQNIDLDSIEPNQKADDPVHGDLRQRAADRLNDALGEIDSLLDFDRDPSLHRSLVLEKEIHRLRSLPRPEDDDQQIAHYRKIVGLEKELEGLDHARQKRGEQRLKTQRAGLKASRVYQIGEMPPEAEAVLRSISEIMQAESAPGEIHELSSATEKPLCAMAMAIEVSNALGDIYQRLGRAELAHDRYTQAWDQQEYLWVKGPARLAEPVKPTFRGSGLLRTHQEIEDYRKLRRPKVPSPPALMCSNPPWKTPTNPRSTQPRALWRARALSLADQTLEALEAFEELVDDRGLGTQPAEIRAAAFFGMGEIHLGQGRTEEAFDQIEQAIELIEGLQANLQLGRLTSSMGESQASLYARAIEVASTLGRHERAFDLNERARSRAFLDQLGNKKLVSHRVPADLSTREEELRQRRIELQNVLRRQAFAQDSASAKIRHELYLLSQEHDRLRERIQRLHPEYASLVTVEPTSIHVLYQTIPARTTLIEFFVLRDRLLAWVIDRETFTPVQINVSAVTLDNQVQRLHTGLADKSFDQNLSEQLHARIFAPLEPFIRHQRVILVPHGSLHKLPFNVLWDSARGSYLVERYTFSQVPNASSLRFLATRPADFQGRVLALGNPHGDLPGAGREAEHVAALFGQRPHLGARARESLVHRKTADILHLAAHGEFLNHAPLSSHVKLSADSHAMADLTANGELEVREIYGLDLSETDLVVLSACHTARGSNSRGDEVVSLARAFLAAGAAQVITARWAIDDKASATLMTSFYGHLLNGSGADGTSTNLAPAAHSLRQAQLEMLTHEKWSSPSFWAAFTSTGVLQ